ncbi:MAG: carboxypeptidase regulatory-like domain-containing protein [Candidatus Acidiferrum sp.]
MPRRYSRVFCTLLLLAPASCLGQEPLKVALSGSIREAGTGHVIGDARIELQNAMGTPIGFAYSDRNGTYQFDDIPGDCYVSVQHEGYESAREFVRPTGAGHVYRDILLRATGGAAAPKVAPAVSEHQLRIPRKAREEFDKGIQLIVDKSDYRGAVKQFAKAIDKYPSYYEAYAAMGLAQSKMGDAAAAESALRKSISMSSEKYPQAMLDLASMFNSRKQFSEAEPLLRKAIALDASSWRAQFELAVAVAGQNRFKDAAASAAVARDLKPDNQQIYLLLYNLHIQANDFPAALRDTQGYLKLAPDGPLSDRVRRMQEQVQKALQKSAAASGNSSLTAPSAPPSGGAAVPEGISLKILLQLPENIPFDGSATLKLVTAAGATVAEDISDDSTSDATFHNLLPGSYFIEAIAPGFAFIKQNIEITPGLAPNPVTLTLTPQPVDSTSQGSNASSSPSENAVVPPHLDDSDPDVAVNIPCALPSILQGAGRRAEQLLNSMQKFDASERVEHYKLSTAGIPGSADVRSFDYVVSVSHDPHGSFHLQEYRNGVIVSPAQFPSGIATANLSLHALIFHPRLASGFHFACEGLGEWKAHSAWLVRFEEKPGNLNPFRSYEIDGVHYPVLLTGRAWIDASTFQVVHLESDLLNPVPKIRLSREHISIDYAAVQFRSRHQQLWLPQSADLYVELNGHRFYRRHTFSNFKIFSTDTAQQVQGPKASFCFTNTSGSLITGVLNATPVSGKALKPASLTLAIPAKSTVCKTVGAGKEVNIPVEFLATSSFAFDGPAGSVETESYLPNGSAPQLISNGNPPLAQHP